MDNKKLTIEAVEKQNEKSKEILKINLSNGDYLNIRPFLSREDLENIIGSYGEFLIDKEVKDIVKKKEIMVFLQCFVILNNSDLIENTDITSNSDKLKYCTLLFNNPVIFDEIISKFDINSLELIVKKFSDIMKIAKKIEEVNSIRKNKNKDKKKK